MQVKATVESGLSAACLDRPTPPTSDEGLHCPQCDYNLTGIASPRCPECGQVLDWEAIRRDRDLEINAPGTAWERWPRPGGFVQTCLQTALLPWQVARQLPIRPRLAMPLAFAVICFLAPVGAMLAWDSSERHFLPIWQVSALLCIALQTIVLGWLSRPRRVRFAWRFWLAVSCYASYPILIEAAPGIGPPVLTFGCSNVWPLSLTADRSFTSISELTPTVLFYLWWFDLTMIAAVRTCRSVWRCLLVCALIAAVAVAVSYFGRYCGPRLFGF